MSDLESLNKERFELLSKHLDAVKQLRHLEAQTHSQRAAVVELEAKLAELDHKRQQHGAQVSSDGGAMLW